MKRFYGILLCIAVLFSISCFIYDKCTSDLVVKDFEPTPKEKFEAIYKKEEEVMAKVKTEILETGTITTKEMNELKETGEAAGRAEVAEQAEVNRQTRLETYEKNAAENEEAWGEFVGSVEDENPSPFKETWMLLKYLGTNFINGVHNGYLKMLYPNDWTKD